MFFCSKITLFKFIYIGGYFFTNPNKIFRIGYFRTTYGVPANRILRSVYYFPNESSALKSLTIYIIYNL